MTKRSLIILFLLLIPVLNGCTTVRYYHQATMGQLSLLWQREPVEDVLAAPDTPPPLKRKLMTAREARTFARERLSLPVGGTFSDYVQLERSHVVYNLVIAPVDSLQPKAWCYPVVGCQSYRGYFQLEDARRERRDYPEEDYDTFIGGVTAYSTLGWFDDPLHTGFTRLPSHRMVSLMFHELAHQVVYIDGDTRFNESFATAVELEGLRLWLSSRDGGGNASGRFQQVLAAQERRRETLSMIEETAERLKALYAQELPRQETLAQKARIIESLRSRYRQKERQWAKPGPLHHLIDDLNNAIISLFRQYNTDVPAFRQLLANHQGDFRAFYEAVRTLGDLPAGQRRQRLDALASDWQQRSASSDPSSRPHAQDSVQAF